MDLPAAAFMPELIEAYPDAKVIVAERDANAWYRSVQNTLVQFQPGLMDFCEYFRSLALTCFSLFVLAYERLRA